MNNEEFDRRLENGDLIVANLNPGEWRGFLFHLLKSERLGSVLQKVRPLYDGDAWTESTALPLLQLLDSLKPFQRNWQILTRQCPELLNDDFCAAVVDATELAQAAISGSRNSSFSVTCQPSGTGTGSLSRTTELLSLTNEELEGLVDTGKLVVADLTPDSWRGFVFHLLQSESFGMVLRRVRPFYVGNTWNESLALSWLQILDSMKTFQSDWATLTLECPELLNDDLMLRLYSESALAEAANSGSYVAPDTGTVSEVVMYLTSQLSVQAGGCFYCG